MLTLIEQQELLDLARWITKCATIKGPADTTGYLIKPDVMTQLKLLVAQVDVVAEASGN